MIALWRPVPGACACVLPAPREVSGVSAGQADPQNRLNSLALLVAVWYVVAFVLPVRVFANMEEA
jgi:hypothetical protein